ncbi:ChaN family lipoprotein [Pseudoalteromonas sp. 20-92]|uniref:ChaN family lipoprotein n=1 Tax=Pseudoalteromonas sp. 20-92 TaxID=2969394 RepID=UPI0027B6A1DA|nr:ChaN family lipoprotein [Pseudoalteromonas sp. 20-92]MDQ2044912.1 ChaN family lipoprotein [Pseudoalteromonas sp. 20-92]
MNKINMDVNYRTMAGNARLVIIAESSHSPVSYKYEAIKALKQLKAAGFTHFAMEMLPVKIKEKIDFYQRTGKGFDVIKQHFKSKWNWTNASSTGYGELVKAANSLGMKIIPLDMPIEMMDEIDGRCNWEQADTGSCTDSHIERNHMWADILSKSLKLEKGSRIVTFMHRYHAFHAGNKHIGIDSIMLNLKVSRISIIEYIGGVTCNDNGVCKGEADAEKPLRETYFYRKGTYIPSLLPSYTVHIPEKAILRK